ncbi:MAG: aldehyde dehydrogenase family protein [Novosphingobium sp. 28-62-57]|uniref:aldehyde dehydrogenase family protein n=1 Tax=unclassified Novosphingobium TaxID=2644732 RepID=UPI000BD6369C|nr:MULTISPECIES: aldehyde dehydrogenase family protein [unclassified Novosphingobium]OYW48182.1 MAG: aldehyde dehydrogenase family protein [Novosphingobium sp. 12-63-9]OYZ08937.1 MAG: aldehyde dehydrogenase family protein [Novosphingobium sp. 28-62-57]OZA39647.1 MAG: aldehyde dehydrogenase family protein [Novosphingobium sp. 17-62-9]HQS68260.1 aldehyde dehydrogenase family protein [Novosphingobium sp.]
MTGALAQGLPQAVGHAGDAYVGGQWVPVSGSERLSVINPANGALVAELTGGTAADLDRAVAAARAAFPAFAASPVAERLALLERIHALILERAEPLAQVLVREMGAAITHARTAHVPFAAAHVQAAIDVLRDYQFLTMRGTTAIVREPIGVAGLITPWNWPLYQITAKVAPALAAGCTVVLKPSELSPLSALMFAQIVHDAGAPAGVFNLVNGTGSEVGAGMAAHPDIDMISITGSNRAGVLVAQGAAPTVKRVTQELGGKSPNLMLPDADFDRVVPLGLMAAFRNVGQSCSAPTRMIVPRARLAQVEALARQTVESIIVGNPANEATTLGPIANRAQFRRVQAMILVGLEEGARLVCGGLGSPEGLSDGLYVHPTVFSDVSSAMRIAQEEIFGPVLAIIPYDTVDEAVAIANDTVFGLGGHVQGRDLAQAREVALRIRTGQVHINYPAWDAHAPFGGYKRSGNGREYGAFGFEEYLEVKAILGFA